MIGAISGSASAVNENGNKELFPANYSIPEKPYTIRVEVKNTGSVPDTGDHGFMTAELNGSDKTEQKSFISPIITFIISTIIALIILSKIKTIQRKNIGFTKASNHFGLNTPRIFHKIKNPALLLAICFGISVSTPLFILNSITSIATDGVEKINYREHDFDADIENGINPFQIKLKEPTFNAKNGQNISLIEVKIEAETYNPTGYKVILDPDCVVIDKIVGEKSKCEETGTNLVSEKNKIPSIKKEMTIKEMKAQSSAGWGWSVDGENFTPANETIVLSGGDTIYYAIKTSDETPDGVYTIPQNVVALTNTIDDEFAKYTINYSDLNISESKTFYKKEPGYFVVKAPKDGVNPFKGWSLEKTPVDDTALFQPDSHLTPKSTETNLYAIWDTQYGIVFHHGYYFQEMFVTETVEEPCDMSDHKCREEEPDDTNAKKRAGEKKYQTTDDDPNPEKTKKRHFEFIVADVNNLSKVNLNNENGTANANYVPKLKGYSFLGWTDFDPEPSCHISMIESHDGSGEGNDTELENTIACLSNNENGGVFYKYDANRTKFVVRKLGTAEPDQDSEDEEEAIITLTPDNRTLELYAVYKLNEINYKVEYYNADGEYQKSQTDNYTKSASGRVAEIELDNTAAESWQSINDCSIYESGEKASVGWEDMGIVNEKNETVAIERLKPYDEEKPCTPTDPFETYSSSQSSTTTPSTTNASNSSNSSSSTTSSSPKNSSSTNSSNTLNTNSLNSVSPKSGIRVEDITAVLNDYYNTDEDENEDENKEKTEKDDDEEKEVKVVERRVVVAPAPTAQTTTETPKDEGKTDEEEEPTIMFYEDDDNATTYFTKPLGVTEEKLTEESPDSIVTTICVIVLVVSGIGIAAIILFPLLSKNQKKKKPARF